MEPTSGFGSESVRPMTLDRNALLQAYTTMRRIREFEERVNSEFVAGHVPGFVHLYSGEEAIAVRQVASADKDLEQTAAQRRAS